MRCTLWIPLQTGLSGFNIPNQNNNNNTINNNKVGDFFGRTKFVEEDAATVLAMSAVPFPRLHFFTFDSNLGQTLEDSSLLTASVTVGPGPLGSVAEEKFLKTFVMFGADKKVR